VQQHTLGVVGYIIWVLFTIYSSFQTVKELWKSVRFWPPSVDGPLLGTQCLRLYVYSAPVLERSIAISLSVCLLVCLSVREHISETAGPICTEFVVQISCGRGSILLWRRCDTLCTSGFTDDVTFGVMGCTAMRG